MNCISFEAIIRSDILNRVVPMINEDINISAVESLAVGLVEMQTRPSVCECEGHQPSEFPE
jgi:hypothetical protein